MSEALPPKSGRILLSSVETAKALGISPRFLWSKTKSGELRCVRIGRRVLYDPRDVQAWIDAQKVVRR